MLSLVFYYSELV